MDPFLSLTHFLYLKLVFNILIFFTQYQLFFHLQLGKKSTLLFSCAILSNKYILLLCWLVDLKIKELFVRNQDIKFWFASLQAFKHFNPGNNFHVNVHSSNYKYCPQKLFMYQQILLMDHTTAQGSEKRAVSFSRRKTNFGKLVKI